MKKGILLLRTSKDEQETAQQMKECMEYIEEQGITLIATLEAKESAYKNSYTEREQMQQTMSMARSGAIDCVVAWKTDRLARDMDAISFFSCLMSNNVAYHSVTEGGLQGTELIDKFMLAVRLFQGEQESENGSKRIKAKIRELNSRGIYVQGGIPYGIKLIDTGVVRNHAKGTTQKELTLDEEKSNVIRTIYNLYLYKNYGCGRIATYLNEHNITTPNNGRLWRSNTVRNILTNQAYVGKLRYNTKTFENPKEKKTTNIPKENWKYKEFPQLRIVSDEEFNNVQELLDKKNTKKNCVSTNSNTHLFSGILKCGYCGESVYANSTNVQKVRVDGSVHKFKKYHYNCKGKLNDKFGHEQTAYSKNKLDETLEKEILEVIDSIEYKDLSEYKGTTVKKEMELIKEKYQELLKEIDDKKEEQEGINKEIRKSVLGKSEYSQKTLASILSDVSEELEELFAKEEKMKFVLKEHEIKLSSESTFNEAIKHWSQIYNVATFEEKKALLSKIIDSIVLKRGEFQINYKITLPKGYGERTNNNCDVYSEHTTKIEFSKTLSF